MLDWAHLKPEIIKMVGMIAGAFLASYFNEKLSKGEKVVYTIFGAAAAYFLTPLAVELLGLVLVVGDDLLPTIGFLVAVVSINLVRGFHRLSVEWRINPMSLIERLSRVARAWKNDGDYPVYQEKEAEGSEGGSENVSEE